MGIFARIEPDGADRIDPHLIAAGFTLYSTGDFTGEQIVLALGLRLANPLTTAEKADLTAIAGQVTGSATAKMAYVLKLESLVMVATNGLVTETDFKSKLGI